MKSYAITHANMEWLICEDGGHIADLILRESHLKQERGALWYGRVGRPIKGLGGCFVDFGETQGFLRSKQLPPAGTKMIFEVISPPSSDKLMTVTDRISLRGQFVIITPGRNGINISRDIKDPDTRKRLEQLPLNIDGGILRSAAEHASDQEILAEAEELQTNWSSVQTSTIGNIKTAPSAAELSISEWGASFESGFPDYICDALETALQSPTPLGGGNMMIQETRALAAIDIDTASNTSTTAGIDVNIRAMDALPRLLALRGISGQVVIDIAPMSTKHRKTLENRFSRACKQQKLDAHIVGWTPLGHCEIIVKRTRRSIGGFKRPI